MLGSRSEVAPGLLPEVVQLPPALLLHAAYLPACQSLHWALACCRQVHGDHQEVMLGYSDSGKDAGRVAAAWALYGCQEQLVEASCSTALRACPLL